MIILFRKGTSHVINNVTCEMQIINEFGFEGLLAENGGEWYFSPKDTIKPKLKKVPISSSGTAIKVPIPDSGTAIKVIEKSKESK